MIYEFGKEHQLPDRQTNKTNKQADGLTDVHTIIQTRMRKRKRKIAILKRRRGRKSTACRLRDLFLVFLNQMYFHFVSVVYKGRHLLSFPSSLVLVVNCFVLVPLIAKAIAIAAGCLLTRS